MPQRPPSHSTFAALSALAVLMCILTVGGFIFWYAGWDQGTIIVANNPVTRPTPYAGVAAVAGNDADFTVSLRGIELARLAEGEKAFSNRKHVWGQIPSQFVGWRFTRIAGGGKTHLTISARRSVTLYGATATDEPRADTVGWTAVPGASFTYNDWGRTRMDVYSRRLAPGEVLVVPQENWSGLIILIPPSHSP